MIAEFGTVGLPGATSKTFDQVTKIIGHYTAANLIGLEITASSGTATIGASNINVPVLYDASTFGQIVRIYGCYSRSLHCISRLGIQAEANTGGPIGSNIAMDDQPFEINIPYNLNVASLTFTYTANTITSIKVGVTVAPQPRQPRVGQYKIGPFGISTAQGLFFDQSYGLRSSTLQRLSFHYDMTKITGITTEHTNSIPLENYFGTSGIVVSIPASPMASLDTDTISVIHGKFTPGMVLQIGGATSANFPIAGATNPAGSSFSVTLLPRTTRINSIFGYATANHLEAIGFNLIDAWHI